MRTKTRHLLPPLLMTMIAALIVIFVTDARAQKAGATAATQTPAQSVITRTTEKTTSADTPTNQTAPQTSAPSVADVPTTNQAAPADAPPSQDANNAATAPENPTSDRLPFMVDDRAAAANNVAGSEAPSVVGLLTKTIGALLIIVGLIFGVGWVSKRYGATRYGVANGAKPALAVLSNVSLGERRSLSVVKFGARTLLIGSTAQAITLLAEEDAEQDYEESVASSQTMPPARSVADMLKQSEAAPHFAAELQAAQKQLRETNAARAHWQHEEAAAEHGGAA